MYCYKWSWLTFAELSLVSRYCADKDFMLQVTVTLTFDLLTTHSIGIICRPWTTEIKYGVPKLNAFHVNERTRILCSNSLWPWPLKSACPSALLPALLLARLLTFQNTRQPTHSLTHPSPPTYSLTLITVSCPKTSIVFTCFACDLFFKPFL